MRDAATGRESLMDARIEDLLIAVASPDRHEDSPERKAAWDEIKRRTSMWERLCDHFSEELVARWHEPDDVNCASLAEFMGLTEDQYSAWVECRFGEVLP